MSIVNFHTLYKPKFDTDKDGWGKYRPEDMKPNPAYVSKDEQRYDLYLPFKLKDGKIVMIDTYHIAPQGFKNDRYQDFIKFLDKMNLDPHYSGKNTGHDFNGESTYEIPFVNDYYYKHFKIFENEKDLQENFNRLFEPVVCLDEIHPVDAKEFDKYDEKDKKSGIKLWFECNWPTGFCCVKNNAKIKDKQSGFRR